MSELGVGTCRGLAGGALLLAVSGGSKYHAQPMGPLEVGLRRVLPFGSFSECLLIVL